ncbi:MAG TPA: hypothetical protein VJO53_07765 [Candidatus Acidoferrales bacterium]|nr:hypothetical protein [Candidatus Acidoferrales bacterium]
MLPPKLMASHPATLAVLGVEGKLASGVAVHLGDRQTVTTDGTGRASFAVPATGSYLVATASGASVAALVDPAVGLSEPQAVTLPPVVSVRDRFWICGAGLSGEADANIVKINGETALVLAASLECIVVLPGTKAAPGPASISVEAPGVKWSATTTIVSLEFEAPNPLLKPGQKGRLGIRVRGSSDKMRIVVRNETPGVLRFLGSDTLEVVSGGGPENLAGISVQAVTSGNFSFRAHLVPAPDAAGAGRYLLAAATLAPKDVRRELLDIARRLKRHPRDTRWMQVRLQRIATRTMAGDFRTLVDSARADL